MKKEVSPAVLIVVLVLLAGGIIAGFARSSGCGRDSTKLNANDYKFHPGEMRARLRSGAVGAPKR